jgi:hypothetical protein
MRKVRGEDGSHRRELNLQRHFGKTNSPAGPSEEVKSRCALGGTQVEID